jgi:hypothetical protein
MCMFVNRHFWMDMWGGGMENQVTFNNFFADYACHMAIKIH